MGPEYGSSSSAVIWCDEISSVEEANPLIYLLRLNQPLELNRVGESSVSPLASPQVRLLVGILEGNYLPLLLQSDDTIWANVWE